MRVCLIRHGSTSWNEAGRIQGRTDVPLSELGAAQVRSWRVPPGFADAVCLTSPLARASETAKLLGLAPSVDLRLAEMDWGGFEGRTLAELRADTGASMRELEDAGLDFRPPGGESPRLVAARLAACLRDVASTGRDHVLVTHKGVLRASLVLAFGWDMLGKPPVRCAPGRALVHELDQDGRLSFLSAPDLGAPW
jgi:probable phosphoglycerate mutase